MNKIKVLAVLAAASFLFPPSSGAVDLSLRLSSGIAWLKAGEINLALTGWREGWRFQAEGDPDLSLENEASGAVHLGIDFEAELLLSFSRWLALGLSAGYSYASTDEERTRLSIRQDEILFDYARPTQVSAYPVFLSAYAFLPLGQKFRAYLRAGVGSMYVKCVVREANKKAAAERFAYTLYESATARQAGYLGAVGLSYTFDQSLSFFAEALIRWTEVSGFEGEDAQGMGGRLYTYEERRPDIDFWQYKMALHPEEPGGESVRNVQEATVDFSGYSIKIGLSLKL